MRSVINNGASGASVRSALNTMSAELYARPSAYPTICGAGDSLLTKSYSTTAGTYQLLASISNLIDLGCFAIGGKRSDEIAAQLASIIALSPNYTVIDGGVNDVLAPVSLAQAKTNIAANLQTLRAVGIIPIDMGMPPSNTPANVPSYVQLELWRILYCLKNGIPHADIWRRLANPNGSWKTGLFADAIHPNMAGRQIIAPELLATIKGDASIIRTPLALTDTASDLGTNHAVISNAISFAAASGTTPATNFPSFVGTAGSVAYSTTAPDAGDFGNWLTIALTSAVNWELWMGWGSGGSPSSATLGWNVGDRIGVGYRLRFDANVTVESQLFWTNSGSATFGPAGYADTDSHLLWPLAGTLSPTDLTVWREGTVTSTGTAGNAQPYPILRVNGSGTVKLARPIVVNLTKLGFTS